ncbi:hypothetical protein JZ751_006046, partial [Albula glossodonta]
MTLRFIEIIVSKHERCINDSAMETKRYQGFSEGVDKERRWAQVSNAMEYLCTMEEESKTNSDVLMDIVNITCSPNAIAGMKENQGEKMDQISVSQSHNQQQFVFPVLNNAVNSVKLEMDSKELSKTVAESMGLYMNAAREADYGFGSQNAQEAGLTSPGKLYPNGGPDLGNSNLSAPLSCQKPKNLDLLVSDPYPTMSQPSDVPSVVCPSGVLPGPEDTLAPALRCSPQNSNGSISSPISNNFVSSTASPPNFGNSCPAVNSPTNQVPALPGLAHIPHPRISTTCSPINTGNIGSPLSSPPNVMRSPISSPQSMGSVRSPPSCNPNARSSVSSPTGSTNNMRESISSPGNVNAMSVSSPANSTGFPMSSPASGLGLVQNDGQSPKKTDQEFKVFEFPKVEKVDGELYSVGLDQMGM